MFRVEEKFQPSTQERNSRTQKDVKIFSGFTSVANPQVPSYQIARFFYFFISIYLVLE
jgi:hypothetical protein